MIWAFETSATENLVTKEATRPKTAVENFILLLDSLVVFFFFLLLLFLIAKIVSVLNGKTKKYLIVFWVFFAWV